MSADFRRFSDGIWDVSTCCAGPIARRNTGTLQSS